MGSELGDRYWWNGINVKWRSGVGECGEYGGEYV